MTYSPAEQFGAALRSLAARPGVLAALMASEDGLPIAVQMGPGHDAEIWSAAASVMGRLAQRALTEMGKGDLEVGVIDTDRFRIVLRPLSVGFLLAVCGSEASIVQIAARMAEVAVALDHAAAPMMGVPAVALG